MMDFTFMSPASQVLYVRKDVESAVWTQEEYKLECIFPRTEKAIERGMWVGFTDEDGVFQVFEVRQVKTFEPLAVQEIQCEHIALAELGDEYIPGITPTNVTADAAVAMSLQNTQWQIGTTITTGTESTVIDDSNAWKALCAIRDTWNVRLSPRVTFNASGIVGRFIDIQSAEPTYRGVLLTLRRNVESAGVTYDDRFLYTALYGIGKSVSDGNGGQIKTGFSDAVWSTAAGHPADKPAGQGWVEDAAATAAYGRNGRKRMSSVTFSDVEDPAELLQKTWEYLQTVNKPRVTFDITCVDLRRYGYAGEPLRLGDEVIVEIESLGTAVRATVIKLKLDLLQPEKTKPTIGNYRADIVYLNSQTARNASVGARVAQANPNLLDGYIDTMVTRIMSSKTNRYTDPADGGDTYVSDDGNKATHMAGAGILLANSKAGGGFNWRTAITGDGIVADEITGGILRAALVKILGNDNFFWDAANIYILDHTDANRQIRIGQYDGVNYGIGYTHDGGATWQTSIDFDGTNFSAVSQVYVQALEPSGAKKGDVWIRKNLGATWNALQSKTWANLAGVAWEELLPQEARTFVYDGENWVLTSDMETQEQLASQIHQTAEEISLKVSKGDIISEINQSAEAVSIRANKIDFTSDGVTFYGADGSVVFRIAYDPGQGSVIQSDLSKRLHLMGKDFYFFNTATNGPVILGRDEDAGYVQQCFYPVTTRTGNLGTPSHIWDTASVRVVFRESEGGLSSREIKRDIKALDEDAVSQIIDALVPVTFIYRDDPLGKEHYGLVYEDTKPVAPLLCVQLKDGDTNPRNFGIDYSSMSVLLLKAIQKLQARMVALESKLMKEEK